MATLEDLEARVAALEASQADFRTETRGRFRSVDEQLTEIKDLIIDRRNAL